MDKLGDFSLTTDDNEVKNRLNPGSYDINAKWPKFLGDHGSGAFTVKEQNYLNRWYNSSSNNDFNSIKNAVTSYLGTSVAAGKSKGNKDYKQTSIPKDPRQRTE